MRFDGDAGGFDERLDQHRSRSNTDHRYLDATRDHDDHDDRLEPLFSRERIFFFSTRPARVRRGNPREAEQPPHHLEVPESPINHEGVGSGGTTDPLPCLTSD
ncbi:hypothetical protein [Haloferax sp. Atlit-12N]|uniref:hypothetical protein n=1 Tax=Haloferax sp. Atlit-12N TaxID=2077203 RepID=UPI0011E5C603|nr:hypothetical protein [Haloferax sp. Atlit-12N]